MMTRLQISKKMLTSIAREREQLLRRLERLDIGAEALKLLIAQEERAVAPPKRRR